MHNIAIIRMDRKKYNKYYKKMQNNCAIQL